MKKNRLEDDRPEPAKKSSSTPLYETRDTRFEHRQELLISHEKGTEKRRIEKRRAKDIEHRQ